MPTGYTAEIYNGKEIAFEKFVMQCARAFGALVTMREDSLDAPIPEKFEPSDWNLKELEKAQQKLAEIKSWDDEQAEKEAEKDYTEALNDRSKLIAKENILRQRYEDMLTKVKAWTPPTPDHEELKKFMIQQLTSSIDFDCGYEPEIPVKLSGAEYKAKQLQDAQRDIEYHTREYQKEVERARGRNEWLDALRKSLNLA